MMIYDIFYDSPVGKIRLRSDEEFLLGADFVTDGRVGESVSSPLKKAMDWLDDYFAGKIPSIDVPLKLSGTPFQLRVWQELEKIPYGQTTTYWQIAAIIAKERNVPRISAQAVGGAVGKNPIVIIIPCHRVIGANGTLTGYAAGLDIKRRLLRREGKEISDDKVIK